ncbi:MAG TPA: fumarylacetoacetate hydrolase family protein [Vicinamibacterales bacterium]|jgi:2-keto-4-pentenoate hydratase/2-oxohepta-3-ene-1,7-dioic acid hydratase in catechol pathway|nr:fumarylacetoacetate hydrolase family protein [Vicinamibacterales bacterium]
MRRFSVLVLAALLASPTLAGAQGSAAQSAEPFKVGTFSTGTASSGTAPWVGVVLRDRFVIDLSQANAALEKSRAFPRRAMPADMVALINDYESGLKGRIYAIVNDVVQSNALTGARPAYVREVTQVKTHAPIPRPRMIMNTAVNFYSHIAEGAPPEQRAQQIAARKANRGVPYMFLKAPSSVIGTGETILIPYGRTELDWEIEIATVIGRAARYVAAPKALDHVFGYTVMLDISDRGGRPPGGFTGVDWFVMKGQDTFGPMGPYIVPKEFYGDPMTKLKQTLLVGTDQRQQSDASDMIHSVGEVIEYASSLVTLQPGDVIGAGTSGGVGMGTSVRGEQVWLVAGDEITATIDGLGTLRHKVAAAPAPPQGTGSYLPPISSYRRGRGAAPAANPAAGRGK